MLLWAVFLSFYWFLGWFPLPQPPIPGLCLSPDQLVACLPEAFGIFCLSGWGQSRHPSEVFPGKLESYTINNFPVHFQSPCGPGLWRWMDGCIITLPSHHLSRPGTVATASLFLEGQELECQAGKLNNFSPLRHRSFFRELQATESWCEPLSYWSMVLFYQPGTGLCRL